MARRGGERLLVLGLVLHGACSPSGVTPTEIPVDLVDLYAAARCGAVTRCACEPSGWVDAQMCTAAMHSQLDDRATTLREHDATFDAGCFDELLAFWESPEACDATASVPYCAIVHGEGAVGESCASLATQGFSASSCSSGTFCAAEGTCSEAPTPIELHLGEPCIDAQYACVDGTYCDTDTGVCATRIAAGSQCFQIQACSEDTWCAHYEPDGPGTCEPRAEQGEVCGSTSAWDARACLPVDGASRWCVDGTCTFAVAAACGPWL